MLLWILLFDDSTYRCKNYGAGYFCKDIKIDCQYGSGYNTGIDDDYSKRCSYNIRSYYTDCICDKGDYTTASSCYTKGGTYYCKSPYYNADSNDVENTNNKNNSYLIYIGIGSVVLIIGIIIIFIYFKHSKKKNEDDDIYQV
jgi:hypothetical protein